MELAEIISYLATFFLLISYCCRTVWLRVFQILGCCTNIIFACLILDSITSARSIIFANIAYLAINIVQLFREMHRHEQIH